MVQAFRATRVVGHPVEQVWRQLTDWNRAADWLGVDSIRAESDTDVGTKLRFVTRGKERTSEITALDPGRSLTLRSQSRRSHRGLHVHRRAGPHRQSGHAHGGRPHPRRLDAGGTGDQGSDPPFGRAARSRRWTGRWRAPERAAPADSGCRDEFRSGRGSGLVS